ncbi:Sulfate adenylyltransferase subunit 2 [Tripterygium wilfordii]|uniref:Sulfate adenylyltransferase subunit 2 n=1 Tax=Tripterygium wilfordii TaxID=458696 RepID=A0A7J7C3X5_TRIWF|nr:uncharacterized protein LOC119988608 [Tripterygium wilfordii]KAF5728869.1 Sulfate adenylyltransferase subunit 2 [Tripterygium wilfordii]
MAQILNLNNLPAATRAESNGLRLSYATRNKNDNQQWTSLQRKLNCNGRFSCLFSDNRREEQARKALESALGGKKNEFEKWNKEIKKREEVGGGGGDTGGGGWFGWGGRFGWSNGDHFWQEAQQTCLAVLGILIMYLIVAKGELMLAVVFNPLLYCLRGIRNGFSMITSRIQRKSSLDIPAHLADMSRKEVYSSVSAKERVLRKWGNE